MNFRDSDTDYDWIKTRDRDQKNQSRRTLPGTLLPAINPSYTQQNKL